MNKVFFVLLFWTSSVTFAARNFESDVKMTRFVSEGLNKVKTNPEILKNLAVSIKNNKDKIKLNDLILNLKAKPIPKKFEAFLNQLRLKSTKGNIFFSVENSQKSENTILVNGHIEIKFDPNNIWDSLLNSKAKTSLYNLLLPESFAAEKADAVTTAILLTAVANNIEQKVADDYFKIVEKREFHFKNLLDPNFYINTLDTDRTFQARALCTVEDKAKSHIDEFNMNIENTGDSYKISKSNSDVYFTIEPVAKDLNASTLKLCYMLANSNYSIDIGDLTFDSHADYYCLPRGENNKTLNLKEVKDATSKSPTEHSSYSLCKELNLLINKNIQAWNLPQFDITSIESDPELKKVADLIRHERDRFYKVKNIVSTGCQIKSIVSRCDQSGCKASSYVALAGEFDPKLKNWQETEANNTLAIKNLNSRRDDLNKTIKDPNNHSGKEISEATKELELTDNKIKELTESLNIAASPLVVKVQKEILNLSAFGKCCANSPCKKSMFEDAHINMQYEEGSDSKPAAK